METPIINKIKQMNEIQKEVKRYVKDNHKIFEFSLCFKFNFIKATSIKYEEFSIFNSAIFIENFKKLQHLLLKDKIIEEEVLFKILLNFDKALKRKTTLEKLIGRPETIIERTYGKDPALFFLFLDFEKRSDYKLFKQIYDLGVSQGNLTSDMIYYIIEEFRKNETYTKEKISFDRFFAEKEKKGNNILSMF